MILVPRWRKKCSFRSTFGPTPSSSTSCTINILSEASKSSQQARPALFLQEHRTESSRTACAASHSFCSSMPPKGAKASTSASAKSRTSASTSSSASAQSPLSTLYSSYVDSTPKKLKVIDAFLVFLMLSGIIQFVYCALITNFPFNSFIAGFASTVGQFVLAASLRIQANPENGQIFPKVSPERAFGDFLFGSVILHFFVFNFLG